RPFWVGGRWAHWTLSCFESTVLPPPEAPAATINVLQFPRDKVLYTPKWGWISDVRFSRDGRYLALAEHVPSGDDGKIVIIDRAGKKIAESPHYSSINSLAWAPNG